MKNSKKILSTLLVLSMLLGVVLVPGVTPVANAAEATPTIPTATKDPFNMDFETMVDGEVDTSDFTFSVGSTNKAEVRTEETYLYLEKNAAENPAISRDLTDVVDSQYVLISVDLASTAWSGAVMKLTGTTATHTVFAVDANGVISAGSNANGGTIPADGAFVTVTVAVNSSSNKYSVWVGETQIALDAALPSSFGNVTNMAIEMAGEVTGSNLMVDNVKVASYLPVFYTNDFDSEGSEERQLNLMGATNGIAARKTDENGNGYIHLQRATGDAGYVRLHWNYSGNLGSYKQAVYSFKVAVIADSDLFFLVNTGGTDDSTILKFNSSDNYFKAYADNNGPNSTTSSTTLKNVSSWTPGTEYIKIDMVLDGVNDTISVYANGNKTTAYNVGFLGTITTLGRLTLRTHAIGSEMYLDDIAVYAGTEPRDIDPTVIPAVDKVYIDNSFGTADSDGYADLTGFVLTANNEANKAVAPKINHYLYIMQNSTSNRPVVNLDLADYVDSHYIVVSMDLATTTGGAPFYIAMLDANGNETFSLIRIGDGYQGNQVNGSIMIGSVGLTSATALPLDGTYHTFTLVIDTEADTFSLWMDDKSCVWKSNQSSVVPLHKGSSTFDFSKLTKLKFSTGWFSATTSSLTTTTELLVDNIQVYSYERPELKFSGASLTLENSLAINFNADPAIFGQGLYTDPVATFNFGGKEITEPLTLDPATGKYTYKFSGIAPNQMGDTITATLSATYNGETYTSEPIEYSVLKYCQNKLTESASSLNTLLVDLLNYGAEAQTATGYNTESLVNAGLTETQKGFATSTAPDLEESDLNTAYATVENPTAVWKSATLVLHDAVTIRLKFQASNVENLTVKIDGVETPFVKADTADTYYVYYNGLHAGQMREVIEATVYNGETAVSNTITYSIASYAVSKKAVTDGNLGNLVVAMMKYGDSAAAFASQN